MFLNKWESYFWTVHCFPVLWWNNKICMWFLCACVCVHVPVETNRQPPISPVHQYCVLLTNRSSIFSENAEVYSSYPRNLYFLESCASVRYAREGAMQLPLSICTKSQVFSVAWNKMHGVQQAIWLTSREIANFSNVSRWYRKIWYRVSLCFPYIDLCPCSSPRLHESSCEVCGLAEHRAAWSLCLLGFFLPS